MKSRSFIFPNFQYKAASGGLELDPLTNQLPYSWDETRKQLVLAVLKKTEKDEEEIEEQ